MTRVTEPVPEHVVRLSVDGTVVATWSATPEGLEALGAGRLLSLGYVRDRRDLRSIRVTTPGSDAGPRDGTVHQIDATVSDAGRVAGSEERAHRAAHGCGPRFLLDCRPDLLPRRHDPLPVPDADAFPELFRQLFDRSPSRQTTGGHHTTALTDGFSLLHVHEVVGRHNGVDKAIGGAFLEGAALHRLGLITTARISGQIAEKAARAGLAWVASRSVPTTLAVEIAAAVGMPIVARAAGKEARTFGADGVPLGAILAGGESSRFGSPKALATVGGVRIVDRVVRALRRVTPDLAVSANEPALFEDLGLPLLPDAREGLGPLGGIYTALTYAREQGRPGILAVACDMPFPSPALLARLARIAFGYRPPGPASPERSTSAGGAVGNTTGTAGATGEANTTGANGEAELPDVVVPASPGRRGIEPLLAAYSVRCIPAIEAALERGDRRMIGFHDRVTVRTIPLSEVASVCDPTRTFLNVNTREDRERAEAMAAEDGDSESGIVREGGES